MLLNCCLSCHSLLRPVYHLFYAVHLCIPTFWNAKFAAEFTVLWVWQSHSVIILSFSIRPLQIFAVLKCICPVYFFHPQISILREVESERETCSKRERREVFPCELPLIVKAANWLLHNLSWWFLLITLFRINNS